MEAGLYVGIQSTFVNTGYGSGFLPGRHIVVIDTITNALRGGRSFSGQHREHGRPASA